VGAPVPYRHLIAIQTAGPILIASAWPIGRPPSRRDRDVNPPPVKVPLPTEKSRQSIKDRDRLDPLKE